MTIEAAMEWDDYDMVAEVAAENGWPAPRADEDLLMYWRRLCRLYEIESAI